MLEVPVLSPEWITVPCKMQEESYKPWCLNFLPTHSDHHKKSLRLASCVSKVTQVSACADSAWDLIRAPVPDLNSCLMFGCGSSCADTDLNICQPWQCRLLGTSHGASDQAREIAKGSLTYHNNFKERENCSELLKQSTLLEKQHGARLTGFESQFYHYSLYDPR